MKVKVAWVQLPLPRAVMLATVLPVQHGSPAKSYARTVKQVLGEEYVWSKSGGKSDTNPRYALLLPESFTGYGMPVEVIAKGGALKSIGCCGTICPGMAVHGLVVTTTMRSFWHFRFHGQHVKIVSELICVLAWVCVVL